MTGVASSMLVAESPAMRRAIALAERFAPTRTPILLVGATGTGKEVVAQHIHAQSGRAGPFVPVNCGALPRELVESLLFGHRRGAFSGALESRRGYVALADRGTLFLDELLSLPLEGQAKLLRALDTGEIRPLGEEDTCTVEARVVAAVQETLGAALEGADVRYDLFQRVAGVVIELPRLVERPEDIVTLARHFAGLQGQTLDQQAERVLLAYRWPGNVRELRQVVERAGRLVGNGTVPAAAIAEAISLGAPAVSHDTPGGPGQQSSAAWAEARRQLLAACRAHGWNALRIAHSQGISRPTLFRRLRTCGISLQWPHESQRVSRLPETD
jgi:transcriptional regulator with PAS, ATPase and Fis domain